ncbi:glycosyl transferase family protein [Celeribacter marinus]|uniref:Anthranilate phosphoribosyltransferase like n=1 Tax=Celeribacter marinus TaxID=1397108 RepID=A0A0P0A9K9_9RHOB|nr:glycosyl transferase family protein [Celeribacter marinus]ALI55321.1 anthranilate phosphoribosyltransferase like [Celeribacter marinus]SFK12784.1 Anthranilate phosphoribosyltransferase [Celeribacter marinus]
MTLASHVRTLGRGPGRSRSLTQSEAHEAMTQMLSGDAAPESIGALLMLLRMKGEVADEIAGFVAAAQDNLPALPSIDLDWSSYAAGRTRGLPWLLLSAKLVAMNGHRVLIHGWNGADPAIRTGLADAEIPLVEYMNDIAPALDAHSIAYAPLEILHPALFHLLGLREKFGLRSCINTVCRMLNPARAAASVQGVFHPPYRELQQDAAAKLGWRNLTIIKGGGGEFERTPSKPVAGFGLREHLMWEQNFAPLITETTRLSDGPASDTTLRGLWDGSTTDMFAQNIVIGTAALALDTLGDGDALNTAHSLWDARRAR